MGDNRNSTRRTPDNRNRKPQGNSGKKVGKGRRSKASKRRNRLIIYECVLAAALLVVLIVSSKGMLKKDPSAETVSAGVLPSNPTEYRPEGAASAVTAGTKSSDGKVKEQSESKNDNEDPKTGNSDGAKETQETTAPSSGTEGSEVTEKPTAGAKTTGSEDTKETGITEKSVETEKTTEEEKTPETEQTTEEKKTPETEQSTEKKKTSETEQSTETETTSAEQQNNAAKELPETNYTDYSNKKYAWWFVRKKNHEPSGSGEEFDINNYGAYFRNNKAEEGDKVIYLTFDCGYELGYTNSILDTLKKHDAKAIFFVTKPFIKSDPDLVLRMKEEGHMVGNHTVTHPSMPDKGIEKLKEEINGCADYMYEMTGYQMDHYLRPPMGEYSERTLKLTQDLGYKSIFWSIAFKDYDPDNQPGKQYVIDHFSTYHHNGAIPLIHNVSKSDTEALDEVLTMLEKEGYRFGTLDELP